MNKHDMPLYRGTKELFAKPMTRGEYNAYRGWDAPEGEDQSVEGYLVEYTDGGEANDERHDGYISWSPKDVFENTYHSAETHIDRMHGERADLDKKIHDLTAFIGTPAFEDLTQDQRDRLEWQHKIMQDYRNVLDERIGDDTPGAPNGNGGAVVEDGN